MLKMIEAIPESGMAFLFLVHIYKLYYELE